MKFRIELTGSQMMALRTILVTCIYEQPDFTSVDCSQDPPVETNAVELLQILMEAVPVNSFTDAVQRLIP